jgi:hypothetical protein
MTWVVVTVRYTVAFSCVYLPGDCRAGCGLCHGAAAKVHKQPNSQHTVVLATCTHGAVAQVEVLDAKVLVLSGWQFQTAALLPLGGCVLGFCCCCRICTVAHAHTML